MPDQEQYVKVETAAHMRGVTPATIKRRIRDGKIPSIHTPDNVTLVPASFLAQQLAEETSKVDALKQQGYIQVEPALTWDYTDYIVTTIANVAVYLVHPDQKRKDD